jgi:hypothetical protein
MMARPNGVAYLPPGLARNLTHINTISCHNPMHTLRRRRSGGAGVRPVLMGSGMLKIHIYPVESLSNFPDMICTMNQ